MIVGELISSMIYSSCKEGIARNRSMAAGRMVQMISTVCASKMNRAEREFLVIVQIEYETNTKIMVKIIMA